jgi:hypothetical protein
MTEKRWFELFWKCLVCVYVWCVCTYACVMCAWCASARFLLCEIGLGLCVINVITNVVGTNDVWGIGWCLTDRVCIGDAISFCFVYVRTNVYKISAFYLAECQWVRSVRFLFLFCFGLGWGHPSNCKSISCGLTEGMFFLTARSSECNVLPPQLAQTIFCSITLGGLSCKIWFRGGTFYTRGYYTER